MEDSEYIARRILENFSHPVKLKDREISISVSIGISYFPDDGDNLDKLREVCDKRMYKAKKAGENRFQGK